MIRSDFTQCIVIFLEADLTQGNVRLYPSQSPSRAPYPRPAPEISLLATHASPYVKGVLKNGVSGIKKAFTKVWMNLQEQTNNKKSNQSVINKLTFQTHT